MNILQTCWRTENWGETYYWNQRYHRKWGEGVDTENKSKKSITKKSTKCADSEKEKVIAEEISKNEDKAKSSGAKPDEQSSVETKMDEPQSSVEKSDQKVGNLDEKLDDITLQVEGLIE